MNWLLIFSFRYCFLKFEEWRSSDDEKIARRKFCIWLKINYHAFGIDSWVYTAVNQFCGKLFFLISCIFFNYFVKFILALIFEIEICEKNPWPKKNLFSKADFHLSRTKQWTTNVDSRVHADSVDNIWTR